MNKEQLTTAEKRKLRIEQLKAKLQKEENKLNAHIRKERNGQLMAFGIYFELLFKTLNPEEKIKVKERMTKLLKGRNLERALSGLKRIEDKI